MDLNPHSLLVSDPDPVIIMEKFKGKLFRFLGINRTKIFTKITHFADVNKNL